MRSLTPAVLQGALLLSAFFGLVSPHIPVGSLSGWEDSPWFQSPGPIPGANSEHHMAHAALHYGLDPLGGRGGSSIHISGRSEPRSVHSQAAEKLGRSWAAKETQRRLAQKLGDVHSHFGTVSLKDKMGGWELGQDFRPEDDDDDVADDSEESEEERHQRELSDDHEGEDVEEEHENEGEEDQHVEEEGSGAREEEEEEEDFQSRQGKELAEEGEGIWEDHNDNSKTQEHLQNQEADSNSWASNEEADSYKAQGKKAKIGGGQCPNLDELPRDLYSGTGKIYRYGGMQEAEDGSIDFHGMQFRVPVDRESSESGTVRVSTKFKIVTDSVIKVRVTLRQPSIVSTVVPYVQYGESSTMTGNSVKSISGSHAGTLMVPMLKKEPGHSTFGTLSLAFTVPQDTPSTACSAYELKIVVATAASAREEYGCPDPLPSPSLPQNKFSVARDSEVHLSSDKYVITPKDRQEYAAGLDFVYAMELDIQTTTQLRASVAYDFLMGDLTLHLSGGEEHLSVFSKGGDAEDYDGPFETAEGIRLHRLPPGRYSLYLTDSMINQIRPPEESEVKEKLCISFAFSLDLVAVSDVSGKAKPSAKTADVSKQRRTGELVSVEPAVASQLDEQQPLRLLLSFSESLKPLTSAAGSQLDDSDGGVEITCSQGSVDEGVCDAITLVPQNSNDNRKTLNPAEVHLRHGTELAVTFAPKSLRPGVIYVLHIEKDFFKIESGGIVDISGHRGIHTYRAVSCECSGKGRCDADRRCVCRKPYSGSTCSECMVGYRDIGGGNCVKDLKRASCTRYSCNGHGACMSPSYSDGQPVCLCERGYSHTLGSKCDQCAEGYSGYPDCQKDSESDDKMEAKQPCSLPVLPETLDSEGLLEENGKLHLQDLFFMDFEVDSHTMSFTLEKRSSVKLELDLGRFVGKVQVAIALQQLQRKAHGDRGTFDRSQLTWENIDEQVDGALDLASFSRIVGPIGGKAVKYRFVFAYKTLEVTTLESESTECVPMGVELLIQPVTEVAKLASVVQPSCPHPVATSLPIPEHITIPKSGYSSQGCYFLAPTAGDRQMLRGTAVQHVTVDIPLIPGKMARLTSEVGFKFEFSHFKLLLETDPEGDTPKCQSRMSSGSSTGEATKSGDSTRSREGGNDGWALMPEERKAETSKPGTKNDKWDDKGWQLIPSKHKDKDSHSEQGTKERKQQDQFLQDFLDNVLQDISKDKRGNDTPEDEGLFSDRAGRHLMSVDQNDLTGGLRSEPQGEVHETGKSQSLFDCATGQDVHNLNLIDTVLPPGRYVIWIAKDSVSEIGEAERKSAGIDLACLPVDFSLEVRFEDAQPSPATCPGRSLPKKFVEPGYLGLTGERMHVQGTFYMQEARLQRRHTIDFPIRSTPSIFRLHVESRQAVDIRANLYKVRGTGESTRMEMVETENPHSPAGTRGDSILALLDPGSYQLQITFLNPGGIPGRPQWDSESDGTGGLEIQCELLDMEVAIAPAGDLSEDRGWRRECPGEGVMSVPSQADVGVLSEGSSFNVNSKEIHTLASALKAGTKATPRYWAQTTNVSHGFVVGSYQIKIKERSVLKAGLHSDFLHDDLVLEVYDSFGDLVLTGARRFNFNGILSTLKSGHYSLKIRQTRSASDLFELHNHASWETKKDDKGNLYFFNRDQKTTQWHRPTSLAGSQCARFWFWVQIGGSKPERCIHRASSCFPIPSTLNVPGMLGTSDRAHLSGTFAIGKDSRGKLQQKSFITFSVREDSILRVLASNTGVNEVSTEVRLFSDGVQEGMSPDSVAEGTELLRLYPKDEYPEDDSLNSQVLQKQCSPSHDTDSGSFQKKTYVLSLEHSLPQDWVEEEGSQLSFDLQLVVLPSQKSAGGKETQVSENSGYVGQSKTVCSMSEEKEKWPSIGGQMEDLYGCDILEKDNAFMCKTDILGPHFLQDSRPRRQRYAIRINSQSHLRVELGYSTDLAPMSVSLQPLPCPIGAGPCEKIKLGESDFEHTIHSTLGLGSTALIAQWIPEGRYLLTVGEQADKIRRPKQGKSKAHLCQPFSFRLMLQDVKRTSKHQLAPMTALKLPSNLFGTPYLAFTGQTHFAGKYAMSVPGQSTQELRLSVEKERSLIRVDATAEVGQLTVSVERIIRESGQHTQREQVQLVNAGKSEDELPLAMQRGHVLAWLDKGSYILTFRYLPGGERTVLSATKDSRGVFFLQAAVLPESQVKQSRSELKCVETSDSAIPLLKGHKHHVSHFEAGLLYLTGDKISRRKSLKEISLSTKSKSRIRVQLRYDFLMSDVIGAMVKAVSLSAPTKSREKEQHLSAHTWVCQPSFNLCELDIVVGKGNYMLMLYQPRTLPSVLDTCLRYAMKVVIHPTDRQYHSGCNSARMMPKDLRRGIKRFHTGLKEKHRNRMFWSEPDLTVPLSEQDALEETVSIANVDQSSLLHVYWTMPQTGLHVDITLKQQVEFDFQKLADDKAWADQREMFYRVTPGRRRDLEAVVKYRLGQQHQRCPMWGAQVFLRGESDVYRSARCPPVSKEVRPPDTLPVSAKGFGFSQVDTYLPIDKWPVKSPECEKDCHYSWDTRIRVEMASQIDFSLQYDPLVVGYTAVLILSSDGASRIIAEAKPTLRDGAATLKTLSFIHQIPEGSAILRIERVYALPQKDSPLCSLFRWAVAVSPIESDDANDYAVNRPYVLGMQPAGGTGVLVDSNFRITLRASEPIAASTQSSSVRLVPREQLEESTWGLLTGSDQNREGLKQGFDASSIQITEMGENGAQMELSFDVSDSEPGREYVLHFSTTSAHGVKGSQTELPFLQPPPWIFSFTNQACGGKGKQSVFGLCKCADAWAGRNCSACLPGHGWECSGNMYQPEQSLETESSSSAKDSSSVGSSSSGRKHSKGKGRDPTVDEGSKASIWSDNAESGNAKGIENGQQQTSRWESGSKGDTIAANRHQEDANWVADNVPKKKQGAETTDKSSHYNDDAIDADTVTDSSFAGQSATKEGSSDSKSEITGKAVREESKDVRPSRGKQSKQDTLDRHVTKHAALCRLIGCTEKTGWSLVKISAGFGIAATLCGAVLCMMRRRRRNVEGYRLVRYDDDL